MNLHIISTTLMTWTKCFWRNCLLPINSDYLSDLLWWRDGSIKKSQNSNVGLENRKLNLIIYQANNKQTNKQNFLIFLISFFWILRKELPHLSDINIPNFCHYFSLTKQYVVLVKTVSLIHSLVVFKYTLFTDVSLKTWRPAPPLPRSPQKKKKKET